MAEDPDCLFCGIVAGTVPSEKDVLGADGINLLNSCGAAAWQTVFHFHIHVVPRYEDDPLKLPWVPAPGDSDEIARLAGRLRGDDGGS